MKYISSCKNLVLCMKPNRVQIVEGMTVGVPGEHVRFNNHEFETSDKKVIDWLGKHRLKDTSFTAAPILTATSDLPVETTAVTG